ncbi:MAG TPA: glycosyltransferase family 39 protein, partial [Bacteroidia bacterium]|nr:glycosyltransferase family 39 protein [Bacteroidia bacterium]
MFKAGFAASKFVFVFSLSCAIEILTRNRAVPRWFWLPAILLVALRMLHLGADLDDPHIWRQADTANYIWDYYQNGVDLLHPSVCWMGAHKTVIFEFPLPEAMASWVARIFGPELFWNRMLFLGIYLAGAAYFFKIIRHLASANLAAIATLVYMMLPLGIVYSRAVHIDFSAVLCAHAMLYYLMKAVDRESRGYFLASMAFATLGFLIKVPYLFYLALPAAAYIHHHRQWRFFLRSSPLLLLPILSFLAWQWHVTRVNAAMPDWTFIPEYKKLDDMSGWYFGRMKDREVFSHWQLLWGRLKYEILAVIGVPLLLVGGLMQWRNFANNLMRIWALATLVYLLVFFMLNVHHDYYQIPYLAPIAFFIAVPLNGLHGLIGMRNRVVAGLALIACLSLFGLQSIRLTEGKSLNTGEKEYFGTYYKEDELVLKAGRLIQAHTPENALVVATFGGLDCRCPNLLYAARRNGWSIAKPNLSVPVLQRLQQEGATHFALLQIDPMTAELEAYVQQFEMER